MLRIHASFANVVVLLALSIGVGGCAKKAITPPAVTETTSAHVARRNVRASDEIAHLCKLQFADVEKAPKFDFDDAALLAEDRDVLSQIAKCLTSGPLKGRSISLVGRADPRGEEEYNMVLGEYRADSVLWYLSQLGVEENRIGKTSRGKLDAVGTDEDGWAQDRRVDITLESGKRDVAVHDWGY